MLGLRDGNFTILNEIKGPSNLLLPTLSGSSSVMLYLFIWFISHKASTLGR